MSMHDWISKYPRVQALLQDPDEVLEYAPDGERPAPARLEGHTVVNYEAWLALPVRVEYAAELRRCWWMRVTS